MNANEYKILWITGVGHFMAHFYMLLFPSLALFIHTDLGLELGTTLSLGFFMYLLFGLLAPLMGWLGDRWNSRLMLAGMIMGIGIGSLICALSSNTSTMAFGLAVIGFFAAIYHPVGMGLITHCCRGRGRALGNNGVWGSVGIGLGPILAGVAGYLVGWRWTFGLYGMTTLLLGCWFLFWRIDETPIPLTPRAVDRENSTNSTVIFFALLLCCMTLFGFTYRATTVSLPAYFELSMPRLLSLLPASEGDAGKVLSVTVLVSLIYLGTIPAQILGGQLADTWDLRRAYLLLHGLSLPFMLLLSILAEVPLFFAAFGYAFFSIGMQPVENSLVAHLTPSHLRGLGYGLKFILVFGVGSLSVTMIRALVDAERMPDIYRILSILILVLIGFILLLAFLSRRSRWVNG